MRSIHEQRNAPISQIEQRKAAAGIPAWQPFLNIGVFYKLRDKERSKESANILVAFCFLARPFVSFVSHIVRYAPSSTDKSSSLRNQKSTQPNF